MPAFEVPPELLSCRLEDWLRPGERQPGDFASYRAVMDRRGEARKAFLVEHGLPAGWWFFWTWAPAAQRQFLDAGGQPPPRPVLTKGPRP